MSVRRELLTRALTAYAPDGIVDVALAARVADAALPAPEAPWLGVLRLAENTEPDHEVFADLADRLGLAGGLLVVLDHGVELRALDDDDLASIGLRRDTPTTRVDEIADTERQPE